MSDEADGRIVSAPPTADTTPAAPAAAEASSPPAALPQLNLAQKILGLLANILFKPAQTGWNKWLNLGLFVFSLVLLLVMAVISLPSLQNYILEKNPGIKQFLLVDGKPGKLWLEWAGLVLEIIIAVCVGGSLLSAGREKVTVAKHIEEALNKKEEDLVDKLKLYAENMERYFKGLPNDVRAAALALSLDINTVFREAKFRNLFPSLAHLQELIVKLYLTLSIGSKEYAAQLIRVKIIASFPGGLFGIFAYASFFLLVFVKVLIQFYDAASL